MSEASEPLRRIATIIDALGSSPRGITSTRLAEVTALPIPTIHRTLRNLIAIGYVEHEGPGAPFKLGDRLLRLVQPALQEKDIVLAAEPILQRLADRLGCVSGMSSISGLHSSTDPFIEIMPRDRTKALVLAGNGFPLHATAGGKLFLSRLGEADLAAFLAKGLEACRPATITDPVELRRHLAQITRQGYAMCRDECDPGVFSIAVPVHLVGQGLLFAAGAVGLKHTLLDNRSERELVQIVKTAAQELTARLDGLEATPHRARVAVSAA